MISYNPLCSDCILVKQYYIYLMCMFIYSLISGGCSNSQSCFFSGLDTILEQNNFRPKEIPEHTSCDYIFSIILWCSQYFSMKVGICRGWYFSMKVGICRGRYFSMKVRIWHNQYFGTKIRIWHSRYFKYEDENRVSIYSDFCSTAINWLSSFFIRLL